MDSQHSSGSPGTAVSEPKKPHGPGARVFLDSKSLLTKKALDLDAIFYELFDRLRVCQSRHIAERIDFVGGDFSQNPPHDFAAAGFWQCRRPLDGVGFCQAADVLFDGFFSAR